MENDPKQLTPKQQLFCDEYLTDMNATAAALRAGYSAATALNGALTRLPKIKMYLDERVQAKSKQLEITQDMMLRELAKIAFGNMGNYFDADGKMKTMHELDDDQKAALWHVKIQDDGTVDLKMHNKLAAMEKIARLMQFYAPVAEEPKTVYVYLDKKDMDENDCFEDNPVDLAEQEKEAALLKKKAEDEFVYNDSEGVPIFESPIPYGPMCEVYRFDIHDQPDEVIKKLRIYEDMQASLAEHGAANGAGEIFNATNMRRKLSNWLDLELWQLGTSGKGDSDEAIRSNFNWLRSIARSRTKHGTFVRELRYDQMPQRLRNSFAERQSYMKAREESRLGIPTNTDMLVA